MHFNKSTAMAALAASLPITLAQTFSDCNPMVNSSCPDNTGLNTKTISTDFTKGKSQSWSMADGTSLNYGSQGAEFTINKAGQAPTIQTDFYIFYGRVDVTMKASTGTGIVSSVVFESDTLDEIDWEFLGGVPGEVQSNFFGKGNTTAYDRMQQLPVDAATSTFHTYSVDWTADAISWIIDGTTVRTLSRSDPLTLGGYDYPQTPMRIKLGNWAGGGPGMPKGTVEWAGGETDFSAAPFTMYVQNVQITNYNPACSYHYGDKSGSSGSIQLDTSSGCTGAYSSGSGSGSGSASASASSTADPTTTSHSVDPIAPTSTISKPASACSSKTASSGSTTHKPHHTTLTSVVSASTEVPQPGATSSSSSSGTDSESGSGRNSNSNSNGDSNANTTISSSSPSATTSTGPLQQTGNAAAPAMLNGAGASISVLALLAAAFLL